jgi:hypothetical protein
MIDNQWKSLLKMEGHSFAQMKRRNTLLNLLAPYGASDRHRLLPVPRIVLESNRGMAQNPGW